MRREGSGGGNLRGEKRSGGEEDQTEKERERRVK